MLDSSIRILVLIIVVAAFLVVNLFAARSLIRGWYEKGVAITPFEIVGGDASMAPAMARLLLARLGELQRQMQQVQQALKQPAAELLSCPAEPQPKSESAPSEGGPKPNAPVPVMHWHALPVPAALFEPMDLSLSIGGVDVGRFVPWIQRTLLGSRAMQFTVSFSDGLAVVAGDISPLTGKEGSVWLETKEIAPTHIADLLAHKLILAAPRTSKN